MKSELGYLNENSIRKFSNTMKRLPLLITALEILELQKMKNVQSEN